MSPLRNLKDKHFYNNNLKPSRKPSKISKGVKIFYSESFKKDFQSLPKEIQKTAERKLKLFVKNFRHPSLRVKKMEGLQNIWEGSISKSYRFTFLIKNNICILRRIGTHDILKKEK